MEENGKKIQITHTQNLSAHHFNLTVSTPIDTNANIKTILNLNSYIYDQKVECGSGKAIISGKVGLKVVYIDTDNMTNSLTTSTNFNETYVDAAITSGTYLNIAHSNIVNNILSSDSVLKVNCDISITPIAYINLTLNNPLEDNVDLVTKKNELRTTSISNFVETQFNYNTSMETRDVITKVLCSNNHFSAEKVIAENGHGVVEGKILSSVIYETQLNEESVIKELKEVFNVKCDFEISNLSQDDALDLAFIMDKSQENLTTETDNETNVISIQHCIRVCGVVLQNITLEIVDDVFSTKNEIETVLSNRECTKSSENFTLSEVIFNEINLSKEETAIDEIIANMSISPEITNTYIKDGSIYVEGVVSSMFAYVDENKEYKVKQLETPFILNTKIESDALGCVHNNIYIVDNRIKVKRGTVLEVEYTILLNLTIFEKAKYNIVENFTMGKPLNLSNYDYQIFIAKQGESLWDLCKRIKISLNDIHQYNNNLPPIMNGGEKVIIKR